MDHSYNLMDSSNLNYTGSNKILLAKSQNKHLLIHITNIYFSYKKN